MSGGVTKGKLTPNQKRFVEEYAVDRNAAQAYLRAFGRHKSNGSRRSYQTAVKNACLLLKRPEVQAELELCLAEHRKRCAVSAQRVLRELSAIAFMDPSDYFENDPANQGAPKPRPWNDIPPRARRAIAGIKLKRRRLSGGDESTEWEVEELEYKHYNKNDALDKLMKHLGIGNSDALEKLIVAIQSSGGNASSAAVVSSSPTDTIADEDDV